MKDFMLRFLSWVLLIGILLSGRVCPVLVYVLRSFEVARLFGRRGYCSLGWLLMVAS
jgi:hypothetical protein